MKRLDGRTVELLPNEQQVSLYQEAHMDEGHSVEVAAQLALLQFWYNYPGSELNSNDDPFNGPFARYLAYGNERTRSPRWWCATTANLLAFLNRHTGLLVAMEALGLSFGEAYEEAFNLMNQ